MPIRNPVLCQLSDTQDRRNTAEAAPKSANGTRPVAYTAGREEFTFRLERSHNVDGNVAPHTRGLTGMIGLVSDGKRYGRKPTPPKPSSPFAAQSAGGHWDSLEIGLLPDSSRRQCGVNNVSLGTWDAIWDARNGRSGGGHRRKAKDSHESESRRIKLRISGFLKAYIQELTARFFRLQHDFASQTSTACRHQRFSGRVAICLPGTLR